jgi:hypothetical protein
MLPTLDFCLTVITRWATRVSSEVPSSARTYPASTHGIAWLKTWRDLLLHASPA